MFSQTVEYALRAVVFLADRAPQPCRTEDIAAATLVPKPYLIKVLQGLARAQVVRTQRGLRGGVSLVKSPTDLTILEVVNAVEPIVRIRTCPLGITSHGIRLCPLHARIDAALAGVEEAFGRTTLAEVLQEPTESKPLCEAALPALVAGLQLSQDGDSPATDGSS